MGKRKERWTHAPLIWVIGFFRHSSFEFSTHSRNKKRKNSHWLIYCEGRYPGGLVSAPACYSESHFRIAGMHHYEGSHAHAYNRIKQTNKQTNLMHMPIIAQPGPISWIRALNRTNNGTSTSFMTTIFMAFPGSHYSQSDI
jgi:hypothetical protein